MYYLQHTWFKYRHVIDQEFTFMELRIKLDKMKILFGEIVLPREKEIFAFELYNTPALTIALLKEEIPIKGYLFLNRTEFYRRAAFEIENMEEVNNHKEDTAIAWLEAMKGGNR